MKLRINNKQNKIEKKKKNKRRKSIFEWIFVVDDDEDILNLTWTSLSII